jgi:hypothetical protein
LWLCEAKTIFEGNLVFHTKYIEHKRLLFKLFTITKFSTRSDKSIRSSILSKLKKELASHFARCELTDRSVAIRIPLCKLLIILCRFYMKNNNSYTAHFVPVSFVYSKLSFYNMNLTPLLQNDTTVYSPKYIL